MTDKQLQAATGGGDSTRSKKERQRHLIEMIKNVQEKSDTTAKTLIDNLLTPAHVPTSERGHYGLDKAA